MRSSISLIVVFVVLSVTGCGSEEPTVPVERDEMKAYLEEHPEMVISDEELNAQAVGRADEMDE
ncbi:hypothetical protein [Aporhodopirellula aestuarii]|uniref:Secreted protein n=1 Tax=Aporhodopirellula aestuarii TaxID=2950107 RepID=A0ABT0U6N4_9BACT|nr:hypothetical protein [Aporhodopirellula aestuarii]MCM2372613.1 hypothetical protein [Aporhodopirellula aestuarii]